ncbi:MAG: hypothetical protein GYB58_02070 [Gammaproteobacteria bacterium]|nr:hypothetical protein [Gammaproteobacteria bacterium]
MKISLIIITLLAICAYFILSQSESPDLASTKNTPIETVQTLTFVEPSSATLRAEGDSAPLPAAESQPEVIVHTLSDLELFLGGEYAGGILYEGELYDYLMGLWDQTSPEMTENNYQVAFSEIASNGNTGYLIHVSPEYTETDQQNFEYSAKHTDIERLVSSTEFGQRSMDKERVLSRLASEYKPDDITIVNMECMEKKCSVYIDAESDKAFSDFADYVGEHMDAAITSMQGKKLNEGLLWLRF